MDLRKPPTKKEIEMYTTIRLEKEWNNIMDYLHVSTRYIPNKLWKEFPKQWKEELAQSYNIEFNTNGVKISTNSKALKKPITKYDKHKLEENWNILMGNLHEKAQNHDKREIAVEVRQQEWDAYPEEWKNTLKDSPYEYDRDTESLHYKNWQNNE